MGSIRRYVTDRLGFTKVLEIPSIWLSHAVSTVGFIRIVALEKVAGSSPVGHPPRFRMDRSNTRATKSRWTRLRWLWQQCVNNLLAEGLVETSDIVVVNAVEEMRMCVHRLRDGVVPEQKPCSPSSLPCRGSSRHVRRLSGLSMLDGSEA
jgi:hypothetical protein